MTRRVAVKKPRTHFTQEDIALIRAAAKERKRLRDEAMKLSNCELAKKFGGSMTAISAIINYEYTYETAIEN
jgi:hypothetical protein